jgi:hypothetical protein
MLRNIPEEPRSQELSLFCPSLLGIELLHIWKGLDMNACFIFLWNSYDVLLRIVSTFKCLSLR